MPCSARDAGVDPRAMQDAVTKLEHDHVHLTRLVDGLRESTQACLRGEAEPADLKADFDEFLRVAQEELFEHFDVEETGLFPYLVEQFPDTEGTITSLEAGHDRMCGILSRLERALAQPEEQLFADFDSLIALFARFDANFVRHARDEAGLLRSLQTRLSDEQRRTVARLLAEI